MKITTPLEKQPPAGLALRSGAARVLAATPSTPPVSSTRDPVLRRLHALADQLRREAVQRAAAATNPTEA